MEFSMVEMLLVIGLLTPIAERITEFIKDWSWLKDWDRRIIATIAGLVGAGFLAWQGGYSILSCAVAGALVSLPASLLHDLIELLNVTKKSKQDDM